MSNTNQSPWLSSDQLRLAFKKVGRNVKISTMAVIFGGENIEIGDNVRVDAGAKLLAGSGVIRLGSHIHIAANAILSGNGGIDLSDFCMVSFNATLISASDDLTGNCLVGPVFPPEFTNVKRAQITMKRLSVVLAGGIILPGVTMQDGSVLAAGGMLSASTNPWFMYGGVPAKPIKTRSNRCEALAQDWLERWSSNQPSAVHG